MEPEPVVADIHLGDAHHWRYVAEGGSSVVLRYVGTNAPFVGKVARLPKISTDGTYDRAVELKELHMFLRTVGKSLFGPYIDAGVLIHANRATLEAMERLVQPFRERSDRLDCSSSVVLLFLDRTQPVFLGNAASCPGSGAPYAAAAFEIKPKCGFVSASEGICRYCLYQSSKKAAEESTTAVATAVRFCPVDLFSGAPQRMRRALKGLIVSPQNNFRILRVVHCTDGCVTEEGERSFVAAAASLSVTAEQLADAVVAGLQHPAAPFDGAAPHCSVQLTQWCSDGSILPLENSPSLLRHLLFAQLRFDQAVSPTHLHELILSVTPSRPTCTPADCCSLYKNSSVARWNAAQPYEPPLTSARCRADELHGCAVAPAAPFWHASGDISACRNCLDSLIWDVCIGRSLQDVSLVLLLQSVPSGFEVADVNLLCQSTGDPTVFSVECGEHLYICRLSVIDFDRKSPQRIPGWQRRDLQARLDFAMQGVPSPVDAT